MQEEIQGNEEFIDLLIDQLPVSDSFKLKSVELGFSTLRDITNVGWGKLMKLDGFCYTWFNELVKLLNRRGLLELLESK
ncbi:hypothetical protein BCL90_2449 [Pedobacter alluvionis]|uniref:RNA polymerase alpha subunit C-terminal domain-containing protein n=1 Tax=Pedobacter alluvionis TaxID=475253 RepID=A0A497Y4B6_9SPHI|nr:hypothetical protein BCL90_2449 [Pedobacter alluvionis]